MVPDCATLLVVMAGLDAQGEHLDGAHVHRPELVGRLIGLPLGERVPPEALLTVLEKGYGSRLPRHGRSLVFLNKADENAPDPRLVAAARNASADVWVGSAGTPEPSFRCLHESGRHTAVVVLAAGLATRMGPGRRSKVLEEIGGLPLLSRAVLAAKGVAGAGPVVVVVRPDLEREARALLAGQAQAVEAGVSGLRFAVNSHPERGMASSLAVGIEQLGGEDVLVLLADQPFVTASTVERLAAAWATRPRAAAAVISRAEAWGPPTLINRSLLPQLARGEGDRGARRILERYSDALLRVPATSAEFVDVDTPAQLRVADGSDPQPESESESE
jgi:CTP:molybdopterin cytidylyltransferase MocA